MHRHLWMDGWLAGWLGCVSVCLCFEPSPCWYNEAVMR